MSEKRYGARPSRVPPVNPRPAKDVQVFSTRLNVYFLLLI